MPLEPFEEKWKSFGWNTQVVDGHNIESLIDSINNAKKEKNKPSIIIANTVKGKGISFMENDTWWHAGTLTDKQFKKCLPELEELR